VSRIRHTLLAAATQNDDIASNRTIATALTEACLIEYAIKQGGGFSGGRPPLAVRLQALRSGLLGQRALTFAFIAVSSAMLSWVACGRPARSGRGGHPVRSLKKIRSAKHD